MNFAGYQDVKQAAWSSIEMISFLMTLLQNRCYCLQPKEESGVAAEKICLLSKSKWSSDSIHRDSRQGTAPHSLYVLHHGGGPQTAPFFTTSHLQTLSPHPARAPRIRSGNRRALTCQQASASAGSTHSQFSLRTGSRCPEGSEGAGSRCSAQAHPSSERPPAHADVRAPPTG